MYIPFTIPRLPSRVSLGQINLWCNSRLAFKCTHL